VSGSSDFSTNFPATFDRESLESPLTPRAPMVVLFSGGVDSVVAATWLAVRGYPVYGLYLYGDSVSSQESEAASACWRRIQEVFHATRGNRSGLIGDLEILDFSLPWKGQGVDSFVPARNVFYVTAAAAWAYKEFATELRHDNIGVILGAVSDDFVSDKTWSSMATLTAALRENMALPNLVVGSPMVNVTKAASVHQFLSDAVRFGVRDEAEQLLLHNTRSCYDPLAAKGCGMCRSCVRRAVALANGGIPAIEVLRHAFDESMIVRRDFLEVLSRELRESMNRLTSRDSFAAASRMQATQALHNVVHALLHGGN
jgi:7-cyano-7-deazaguanine synthase